ncbi:hypothetical protein JHK85_010239 [Glycine max]|nr:hypothetical protein JHK85_010239 [Glycine max]
MAEDIPSSSPPIAASDTAPLGSSVISLVNRLQDIFARVGSQSTIDLPQVAVVGSQSSGKSSVLEALVGRDFLPRGNEICTRRPLVLQLVQTKAPEDDEYGEFLHFPGRKFHDFSEIRREIQIETDREAGGNKGVSDKQIRLKIFSPNVLDITLVDLPGITKVPVGDQPSDIEARIRTMIMSYIKTPTCLILAVTPANSDLANSDALQMAGIADPDGNRTIGVITKLDIMDRGTDARNLLLGKVIPLRLGYVGVVNRCQEILAQHIMAVLPGLRARISTSLVAVAKEYASYGEITESKACVNTGISFSSMVEGNNEEISTSELFGGARIHYIFQSIFVRSLEEVDPCEDLTDDDIRTAIQNATGPKSAVFAPSISHRCMVIELQRFPFLWKRMDEALGNFLREGLEALENMIAHLIAMELNYINTSHHNFIGGSKALEIASQQTKSSMVSIPVSRQKEVLESDKGSVSERSVKSRAILARQANGVVTEPGVHAASDAEKVVSSGNTGGSSWGISSIFGGGDSHTIVKENVASKPHTEPVHSVEQSFSMIHLREPPPVLRSSESYSETEAIDITVTKLLLRSYYDIVRKNVEDLVPKAIMYFLVDKAKGELHNVFIKKLYRDNLFEEMLREPDEIALKRKRCRELLRAYQQAFKDLEELPLEADTVERGYGLPEKTGLPKINGLPTSSMYSASSSGDYYAAFSKYPKSKKSSHSGELQSPLHADADSNGSGRPLYI